MLKAQSLKPKTFVKAFREIFPGDSVVAHVPVNELLLSPQ